MGKLVKSAILGVASYCRFDSDQRYKKKIIWLCGGIGRHEGLLSKHKVFFTLCLPFFIFSYIYKKKYYEDKIHKRDVK